jgi:hypothetical protein
VPKRSSYHATALPVRKIALIIAIGVVFTLIGVLAPIIAARSDRRYLEQSVETQALITQIRDNGDIDSVWRFTPYISFTDINGNEITTHIHPPDYCRTMEAGNYITIRYNPHDPANPQQIRINAGESRAGVFLIFGGIGVTALVIGIRLMGGIIRTERLRERLTAEGYSVMADVKEVRVRGYSVGNTHPYYLRCTYKEGYRELEFINKAVFTDPRENITDENQIRVWLDRRDESKYYIDVD